MDGGYERRHQDHGVSGNGASLSVISEGMAENTPAHTSLTPAERREHSRKTSNIHTRNLSAFFPRPGTDAEREYHAEAAIAQPPSPAGVTMAGASGEESSSSKQRRNARHVRRASYLMTDKTGNVDVSRRMPSQLPACTFPF